MVWDAEVLRAEVEHEFVRLSELSRDRIEAILWQRKLDHDAEWVSHSQWWAKTTRGKRYFRDFQRTRAKALKSHVVAVRQCTGCGAMFELNAYRERRGRDRVCGTACRGRSRKNISLVEINGEKRPLVEWCARTGIKLSTAWARVRRGWSPERALGLEAS